MTSDYQKMYSRDNKSRGKQNSGNAKNNLDRSDEGRKGGERSRNDSSGRRQQQE